jgi:hypothetical protein
LPTAPSSWPRGSHSTIAAWSLADGSPAWSVTRHLDAVTALATVALADGQLLISGDDDDRTSNEHSTLQPVGIRPTIFCTRGSNRPTADSVSSRLVVGHEYLFLSSAARATDNLMGIASRQVSNGEGDWTF